MHVYILFNYILFNVVAMPHTTHTKLINVTVRQDADRRLLVTSVRLLSDPNARGLIAANIGLYLSLSSPLPSRALSCTLTNVSDAYSRPCPVMRITPMVTRINHRRLVRTTTESRTIMIERTNRSEKPYGLSRPIMIIKTRMIFQNTCILELVESELLW